MATKGQGSGASPGERRGGRQKGSKNKIPTQLKEMILTALDKAGGESYLLQQAQTNPNAFMTLIGKVLPMQITGEGGGPVQIATLDTSKLSDAAIEELLSARRIPTVGG